MCTSETVKIADNDGDTPLHNAARGGFHQLVTLLLKHGADPAAQNKEGRTAAQETDEADVLAALGQVEEGQATKKPKKRARR